jgi:hypothetical protein
MNKKFYFAGKPKLTMPRRSQRVSKKPLQYANEKFLPGTNNGYTAGRHIDPGFAVVEGNEAPFDSWAETYQGGLGCRRPIDDSDDVSYSGAEDEEEEGISDEDEEEEEEWIPTEEEEKEEEEEEWIPTEEDEDEDEEDGDEEDEDEDGEWNDEEEWDEW